jgi:hypothetical protein
MSGVLKITGDGPQIAATWDGKPLLRGTDRNLRPAAGGGHWRTGDRGFDEFVLEPALKRER